MERYDCVTGQRGLLLLGLALPVGLLAATWAGSAGAQALRTAEMAAKPEAPFHEVSSDQAPTDEVATEQATARYRQVIKEAVAERMAGNHAEAGALFFRAHKLRPSARTLLGLGVTEFELKNYPACIERLQAALVSQVRTLDPVKRAEAKALLARAQGFVGYFEVRVNPEKDAQVQGVQLAVDGAAATLNAAGQLLLPLGKHLLRVQAQGHRQQIQALQVRGGERLVLEFTLQPIQPAPARAVAGDVEPDHGTLLQNPWLWTGVGAALVGGVITAIALASGGQAESPEAGGIGGVVETLGVQR